LYRYTIYIERQVFIFACVINSYEMFLKIFKKVVEIILAAELGFREVKMYKGELEEGAEYRDVFPMCYVEFAGDQSPDMLAGDKFAEGLSQVELYIADKDYDEPKGLDLCNSVIDLFDGTDMKIDTEVFKAMYIKTELYAYIAGKGKAYKITIGVH
jgi:hypothetical protein